MEILFFNSSLVNILTPHAMIAEAEITIDWRLFTMGVLQDARGGHEVWLIDVGRKQLEVYRQPGEARYQSAEPQDHLLRRS